jgi:hypothetical protein
MKVGSLVECVADFTRSEIEWGFSYPKRGEVLTVSDISRHPNKSCDTKGIVLLNFEEYPYLVGVCDKTYRGKDNFIELQPPMDMVFIEELQNQTA